MYIAEYDYSKKLVKIKRSDEDHSPLVKHEDTTLVTASFRFGLWTPDKITNEEEFLTRALPHYNPANGSHGELGDYLMDIELLRIHPGQICSPYDISNETGKGFTVKGRLTIPWITMIRPGFNLRLEAPYREVPLEQMINLDRLNRFILTGER